MIPVPLMVLADPLKVTVPEPPERCVNVPAPLVEKFPATFRLVPVAAVMLAPLRVRSLKLLTPAPLSVTAPVLLKVPSFDQFPPTECEKLVPLNVVEAPNTTLPLTVSAERAVNETEVPVPTLLLSVPASVSGPAGIVLTTAPELLLSVRLP